jgi:hypothetical protein
LPEESTTLDKLVVRPWSAQEISILTKCGITHCWVQPSENVANFGNSRPFGCLWNRPTEQIQEIIFKSTWRCQKGIIYHFSPLPEFSRTLFVCLFNPMDSSPNLWTFQFYHYSISPYETIEKLYISALQKFLKFLYLSYSRKKCSRQSPFMSY